MFIHKRILPLAITLCCLASISFAELQKKEAVKLIDDGQAEYQIEVGGSLDSFNTTRFQSVDGRNMLEFPGFQPNVELVIENIGERDVINPRIVINDRHDWFSLDTFVAGVVKPGMSDREKAFAIYEAFRDNFYHYYASELSMNGEVLQSDMYDPIKHLNSYANTAYSLQAICLAKAWTHAGLKSREIDFAMSHSVAEVLYDNAWHMMDSDMKVFILKRDNKTLASVADCLADRELVKRTHHYGFAAPSNAKDDAKKARMYCPNTGILYKASPEHTMALVLRPGESIVRRWDNMGMFHDNRLHAKSKPYFANGKLIYKPDLSKTHFLDAAEWHYNLAMFVADGERPYVHAAKGLKTCQWVFRVQSPYCIVGGTIHVEFTSDFSLYLRPKVFVSADGQHWREVWHGPRKAPFVCDVSINDFIGTKVSNAKYEYYVKLEWFPLRGPTSLGIDSLLIETDLEMSPPSLPTLRLGQNKVVYLDDTQGDRKVRVAHQWQESSANTPPCAPTAAVFPVDGDKNTSLSTLLQWKPATDADGDPIVDYHIEVRDRPDMKYTVSTNLERLTFSGDPQWKVPAGCLIPGRRYYWHIRAKDKRGAWSKWSDAWSFITEKQEFNKGRTDR